MKKIVLVLLMISGVINVFSQSLEYAKEIVLKLSSHEFKGRGYVGDGNGLAATFIKTQYTKMGVKPFGKDFFQQFKIDVNTFPSSMKLQIDGIDLIPGVEFLIDPMSPSLSGEYPVFVIKKQDLLNDNQVRAAIRSLAGKILIIDESTFNIEDKEKIQKVNELINFLKYNSQIPTVATIMYSNDKLSWNNATFQVPKPSFIVKKEIDVKSIKKIKIDVKAKMINYKTQNVVGYIEGIEKPDSFLIVMAHYDHLGMMGADTYFPGANDNASGIAMLLNLAKYFTQNPPKYSVALIALSAEEIGIVGAKYYSEHPLFDLTKIKFLINFDLAGTGDDGIKVVNGNVHHGEFKLLSKINDEKKYLKSVQSRGAACNSDHCPFHEKGVTCFYIYTLGGIQAYHDIYDKSETLPFTAFTNYYLLMVDFLTQI